jgi:hypothetical protein
VSAKITPLNMSDRDVNEHTAGLTRSLFRNSGSTTELMRTMAGKKKKINVRANVTPVVDKN